jgi:2-phosphosulfolactate phosphatase
MDEDALCAEYIKNDLLGIPNDFPSIVKHLKDGGYIDRFLDPAIPRYPAEDVDYCLTLNKFSFVLHASPYTDGLNQLKKVDL